MHILVEEAPTSVIYTIPKRHFPRDDTPDCPSMSIFNFPHFATFNIEGGEELDPQGALTADPKYGIPAVSLYQIQDPKGEHDIHIRFWIDVWPYEDHSMRVFPLDPIRVRGTIQDSEDSSWQLMLLPHSGRMVLMVMNVGGKVGLQLVKCDRQTADVSLHEIDLPPVIDISAVHGLSLDDNRGVISVLDKHGMLYAIPFA